MIHPLSDCQARVPESTNIWQFCVVLPNAKIGENCNICSHCFIENKAVIGNNVTIKNGVQIWDGVTLEDDVFVGSMCPSPTTATHMPRMRHGNSCPLLSSGVPALVPVVPSSVASLSARMP